MKHPNLLIGTPTSRGYIPKNYHDVWFQKRVKAEAARWIKQVRSQARISQTELAELIGITGSTIFDWEKHGNITVAGVVAISEALKIKPFFGMV